MGKPIDKNTKDLNELLDHLHKPADDLDAFEQEALEGFSQLENKQEALDLKHRLDARMEEELFSKKKRPLFIYWSAAAGVALLVSLIFIFKSSGSFDKQALAENTVSNEKSVEGLTSPALKNAIGESKPAEEKMSSDARTAQSSGKKQELLREYNQQMGMGGKSGETTTSAMDLEAEPAKSVEQDVLANKSANKDLDANDDKKRSEDEAPAGANAPATLAKNNEAQTKAKADEEYKETKATEYFSSRKIKKEKEKAAKSAPASESVRSEIEGPYEKSTIKSASLTIKESDLNDKITKFFADKDYKKSFSCTLTIDEYNKVDEVVFTNTGLFKKSEMKEITEFLKKQKCFKNHEYALFSTYTLNYKAQ